MFVALAVVSFAADRVTKLLVLQHMELGERIRVLGDVFELRYVQNRGIAFGLFSDAGSLVVLGTVVVGALLFYFMLHVQPEDLLTVAGGALITGGALGNLYDRVQYGFVVDFLNVPRWPTFNLADVSITLGVVLVLVGQMLVHSEEPRTEGEERQ